MSLNLALVISGDATGARNAAQQTTAAVRETGSASAQTAAAIAAANDQAVASAQRVTQALTGQTAAQRQLWQATQAMIARGTPTDDATYRRRAADVAAYGVELDRLRAKYNPLFAVIRQYRTFQAEIRADYARGAISSAEYTAALGRERQATLASIAALKGRRDALGGISGGAARAAGFNAGQQVQDIVMMAALGQSPTALALQQGPQLATAIQQGGGLAALRTGIMSVINPTTLLTVGLTAASAAALQFVMNLSSGNEKAEKFADWLGAIGKNAATTTEFLRQVNAEVAKLSIVQLNDLQAGGEAKIKELQKQLSNPLATMAGLEGVMDDPAFVETYNKIDALIGKLKGEGYETIEDLHRALGDVVSREPDLQKFAGTWEQIGEAILKSRIAMEGQARQSDRLLYNMQAYQPRNGQAYTDYAVRNAEALRKLQVEDEVSRAQLYARSPAELAAAARKSAEAKRDPTERPEVQKFREDSAAALAYERALKQITDAQDARRRSLDATLASQRLDLELIGKTAAEAAGLRMAFQLEQQVREEAARNNVQVDQAELDRIRQLSTEYGKLAAQQQARSLIDDQEQEIERQRAEVAAMGLSAAARDRVVASMEAEQKIRRLGIPLYGEEAEAIRRNAAELAGLADARARASLQQDLVFERQQLFRSSGEQEIASRLRGTGLGLNSTEAQYMRQNQQFSEWKDTARSFLDTFREELVNSGGDVGKALGQAVLAGVNSILDKIIDRLFDSIANDIASAITGIGKGGSSPFGTADGFARMLFGEAGKVAANDNNFGLKASDFPPMSLSGIGSPGSIVASGAAYNVANATSFIRQYSSSIGIDPDIALRVARSEGLGAGIWQSNYMKGGFREPSYGPFQLLKGGSGTGFGTGLGNAFQRQTGLDPADPGNWQQSTMFALNQAKTNGWGAWYGAKGQGITGFDGIDRSATSASTALDKFATGSTKAVGGVSQLGQAGDQASQGLNTFANNLSKFPAAPSGGGSGGGFGGLGSLLGGGLNSAFSGTAAFSWLSANPGGYIGLFDSGGSILNGNVVPFGPNTRSLGGRGVLADSGFGPRHFPAMLEEGESVLSRDMMGRTMRVLQRAANQNAGDRAPNVVINPVVNNQSSKVTADVETRRNADGSIDLVTTVKDIVADSMVTRGSQVNNALRQGFGAQKRLRRISG